MRTLALFPALVALLFADAASAHLDVVFLLDTTGSMSGEIREAKERVRQIAERLRAERDNERVRLGVVAYRDRTDSWVTKVSPLTEDTDESFRFLAALRADGGGDSPEDVLTGLRVALHELEWDLGDDTERQVFLIGDAPPHLDYDGHVTPEELVGAAVDKRIVVNAVGCRSLGGAGKRFFQRVAYETEGAYHHIGRVRLAGAEPGGLAAAMLKTLATAGEVDEGEPVAVTRVSRAAPLGDTLHAALRQGASDDARGCALDVTMPDGTDLAGPPRVALGDDGLVVTVVAAPGAGTTTRFALPACPPAATPVHVRFGE